MVADRGANARLVAADLPASLEAGAVLVSGYLLLQEGPGGGARAVGPGRRGSGWSRIVAPGRGRRREGFHELAIGATVVLANEREAAVADRARRPPRPARSASAIGAAREARSRGSRAGAGRTVLEAVPEAVEERDPTGAGDAFDGVLLASLARGSSRRGAAAACRAGASGALVASVAGGAVAAEAAVVTAARLRVGDEVARRGLGRAGSSDWRRA